jgi:hypothetical protein
VSLTLDATVGGASANAYVEITDVDVVAPFRPNVGAAWIAASSTPDLQIQAIVQATTRIDQLRFAGSPSNDSQALEWPRENVKDRYCRPIDSGSIPNAVRNATISLAMNYASQIVANTDPITAGESQSIQIAKAGDAEVQYFAPSSVSNPTGWNDVSDLPPDVVRLLNQFLALDPMAVSLSSGWGQSKSIRSS